MEIDKIKKGIRLIFVDFFGLVIGILNGFFLPMAFSIDGYALFKTFTLYVTYAAVFSFGLSNGIYLLYGGKDEAEVDISKTKTYYFFLMKLQVVVCGIMFILSYFILKDKALIFFSLIIFPLQLIDFLRLYYRALGEFNKYSFLQAILVTFELLNTLFIVFYVKSQNPDLFIVIKILNHFVVAVLFSLLFFRRDKVVKAAKLKCKDYFIVMKPGFVVLIADLMVTLIFSIDRWFIKSLFSVEEFAFYSFAVSILTLFLVFITSVTNIFYSSISKKLQDSKYIADLKNCILIISSFFPVSYFLLEYIVKAYLVRYVAALEVLWILILMLPFVSVINVLYINLYKASKSIKIYFKNMVVILVIYFILIILAYIMIGTTAAVAWATFVVFVIWYFYSSYAFQGLKINMREVIYLLVLIAGFICIKAANLNLFLSVAITSVVLTANVMIFYKKDVIGMLKALRVGTND